MKKAQSASLLLPESFKVQWARPEDPQVQAAYKKQQKSSASEADFLELARSRRSSFTQADCFWDSCDELLAARKFAQLSSPPDTLFRPDDFRITAKLGQGGFGCVYKALHLPTGHTVALKELTGNTSEVETLDHRTLPWDCGVLPCYGTFRAGSNFKPAGEGDEDDDKITAVTTKETAALAQDTTRLKTWLILKFCKNGSLVDRLLDDQRGILTEREAARMLKQVIKALLYLKEHHGIVHNDCKPANLLLADDGRSYYLCDLGAAKKGLWQKERLGGTYSYMPPEKLRARKLKGFLTLYCNHEKHDVWSMGVTLFVCLFKRHPFNAKALAKCTTVTSSGQDASEFYDLMETNFDDIQYPKDNKRVLSPELKEVMQGMLTPYCLERLTLNCVREHPWVRRRGSQKIVWSHAKVFVLESLRTLGTRRKSTEHVTEDQAFLKVLWQPTVTMDGSEEDEVAALTSTTVSTSTMTKQSASQKTALSQESSSLMSSVENTC